MLGLAKSSNQTYSAMFYQTSTADVYKDLSKVWMLEKYNSDYAVRNLGRNQLQLQTEWSGTSNDIHWRQNDQAASCEWTGLSLTYADSKWTLTSTKYNRPLGVYNDGTTSPANGTEIGANSTDKSTSFQIYAISRTKFLEKYKTKLSGATADNPRNATLLITNPDFNANNCTGWSGTTGNTGLGGGAAEFWHKSSYDLYQTLTGLANGKYQVNVQVVQEGDKTAQLYATTASGTETAVATATTGAKLNNWTNALISNEVYMGRDEALGKISVTVNVTDGNLTIGLKDADPSNHWVVFDNFTMSYLGTVDLSEYVTAYKAALEAAKAVNQESPMNKDILTALTTALSTYGNVSETDQSALVTATGALNTATANATASIASYVTANTAITNVEKFINSTNFYTEAALNTYKTNDYTNPKTKYDARTLTDTEIAALQDPYVKGGYNAERNVWALLKSAWSDGSIVANTWSTEGDNDGSNFKLPFLQWWVADAQTLPTCTKTGTVEGLTTGKVYEVSANVRVRKSNGKTEVKGVTMDVNGGASVNVSDGTQVGSSQLYLKGVVKTYGLVGEDGKLNINFTAADGNTINWLAFKDVKYTEKDIAVLNEDGDNSSITSAENTNIGVKRSFTSYKWNSVVLPFSMTYSQVQAFFGTGTKTATYTGATADGTTKTITLNFSTSEGNNVSIAANTPCLIRPTKDVTFAVAEGVNVAAPTDASSYDTSSLTVTKGLVNFVGTYKNGGLTVTDQDFFLSNDNKLYRAKGGESIKAFRAIFRLNSNVDSDAKLVMSLDGLDETTSIQSVGKTQGAQYNVYNLAGQVVKRNAASLDGLQKGLYIVNGKKVVVE